MTLTPEEIQAIAAAVWAYMKRSLTTAVAGSAIPSAGEPLVIYRDTTITIDFVTSANLSGATNVWFTVKDDLEKPDADAVLQVEKLAGLNYLNGQEKTVTEEKSWASLVVSETNAVLTATTNASTKLPVYQAKPIHWDLKANFNGVVTILQSGKIYILPTATRMV